MDRRLLRAWAASVGVVVSPFWGVVVGRETAIYGDLRDHHLVNATWSAGRILAGRLPDWAGWAFAGQNIVGAGQSAPFHPATLVFGVLPTRHAFAAWLVLHLALATTGAFVWSWRAWRSRPAAIVSGVAYGLNGFLVMHVLHMNLVLGAAWLPWCFIGIDLLLERWSPRRAVACVAPIAMVGLSGHPQMTWIAVVGLGLYGGARLATRHPDRRAAGRVLIASVLGLGIAAVALLPQVRFAEGSIRREPSTASAFSFATQPEHLAVAWFPGVIGGTHDVPGASGDWRGGVAQQEVANHVGIVVSVLAGIGFVARRRVRQVQALGLMILFALATALARVSPVADIVYHLLPYASSFRAWSRNLVLMNAATAMLAGGGVVALGTMTAAHRRRVVGGVALGTLGVVNLMALTGLDGAIMGRSSFVAALAMPLLALGAALWAVSRWHDRVRVATLVLIAAASANVVTFAYGAPWRHEGLPAAELDALFRGAGLSAVDAAGGLERWVTNDTDLQPWAVVADSGLVNGYDPLLQQDFADVTGLGPSGRPVDDRLWAPGWYPDVLRITTALLDDTSPPDDDWRVATAPADSLLVEFVRTPRLPDAYLGTSVAPLDQSVAPTTLLDPTTDLRSTTYVDSDHVDRVAHLIDAPMAPLVAASGTITDDGRAGFVVDAERNSLLVVSIAWLDGWEATVDGEPAPVVRANGLVLGVPVPAGRHDVRLRFVTPGLATGAWISLSSVIVTVALATVTGITSRRRGSGRTPSRRS